METKPFKVKFTCNWCSDETLKERFDRVYHSKFQSLLFETVSGSNFDFLVIVNSPLYRVNFPKNKTLGVIMEPEYKTTICNFKPTLERLCSHILYHKPETSKQYIYYPGLLPYHFDYTKEAANDRNLDFYVENTFTKSKNCSMVVSYKQKHEMSDYVWNYSLYGQRVEFAKLILNSDLDIDIYGKNWENSGIKDDRIKGTLLNKLDGIIDYEYSICVENCIEKDYISEKITDCILTDTIPIYYGCPNVNRFFETPLQLSALNDVRELSSFFESLNQNNLKRDKGLMVNKFNLYYAVDKFLTRLSRTDLISK